MAELSSFHMKYLKSDFVLILVNRKNKLFSLQDANIPETQEGTDVLRGKVNLIFFLKSETV